MARRRSCERAVDVLERAGGRGGVVRAGERPGGRAEPAAAGLVGEQRDDLVREGAVVADGDRGGGAGASAGSNPTAVPTVGSSVAAASSATTDWLS